MQKDQTATQASNEYAYRICTAVEAQSVTESGDGLTYLPGDTVLYNPMTGRYRNMEAAPVKRLKACRSCIRVFISTGSNHCKACQSSVN